MMKSITFATALLMSMTCFSQAHSTPLTPQASIGFLRPFLSCGTHSRCRKLLNELKDQLGIEILGRFIDKEKSDEGDLMLMVGKLEIALRKQGIYSGEIKDKVEALKLLLLQKAR